VRVPVVVSPTKGEVEIQERDVAEPGPGEVQVGVRASLVSPGTERAWITHMPNTPGKFPFEPGYCSAGVVISTGAGVTGLAAGDRVACFLLGHRQAGNVDARWVMKIPDDLPFAHAAFTPLGQVALQGVRRPRIELGESVLVVGLGIIGQLAAQLARLSGGLPVAGADKVEARRRTARACGADVVFDATRPDWAREAGEHPVVIESTGAPEGVACALQAAARQGRVCLLGSTRGACTLDVYRDIHSKGVVLLGAHAGAVPERDCRPGGWTWRADAECFLRLLAAGRIGLDPLITERVEWARAPQYYRKMIAGAGESIGGVIEWA
jgi:L-iditol 2-dehydrogenase